MMDEVIKSVMKKSSNNPIHHNELNALNQPKALHESHAEDGLGAGAHRRSKAFQP